MGTHEGELLEVVAALETKDKGHDAGSEESGGDETMVHHQ